jgi:Ca2+-transporting ATPase
MQAAERAHIPISIITGDNSATASAIALKTGLAKSESELKIVVGNELADMEDDQIIHLITRGKAIFSRVAPEDKLRIVELGKKSGHVVAVTGDGINDAPALKRADIGVAMGVTGTDVAKQSADIVLLDDSFASLVTAISQGRVIFQNIKKIILSVLTGNASELTVILFSLIAFGIWGIPIAITVVLILAIDLVAELFPVAALGWDSADNEIMDKKPRKLNDHIITKPTTTDIAISGVVIGALAYGIFYLFILKSGVSPSNLSTGSDIYASAITLTYITICFCMFANILARRAPSYRQAFFSKYLFSNRQLILALGMSLTAMLAITYLPIIQRFAGTNSLALIDWLMALSAGLANLIIRWLFIARLRIN